MSEARRIALEVMAEAERRREEFADKEARHGALWDIVA